MKKMMFVVAILVASLSVNGMIPDRKFEYPKAQCFFKNVDGHSRRWPWANGNSEVKRLTLDFDGRKQFIESVRSSNEHTNNFTVTIEANISSKKSICREFKLENSKYNGYHYITTYLFFANGEAKPYLYSPYNGKNGILDDFVFVRPNHPPLYSGYINYFATNVLRILKISKKHLKTKELTKSNLVVNRAIVNTAIEIAAMILTTERARDEYSLLISYIEFYKLKYTDRINQQQMLLGMFNKSNPTLRFPKAPDGASLIQKMKSDEIYNEFIDMLLYTPVYNEYAMLPQDVQSNLAEDFYSDKLDTLNYILYGDHTKSKHTFKIKVKKAYDDYIWNEILPMHIGL